MLSALPSKSDGDLMGLINLMADPKAFKERTEELRKLQKEADAKIALAGKADEILRLREDIERRHLDASTKQELASLQAKKIIDQANKEAEQIKAKWLAFEKERQLTHEQALKKAKEEYDRIIANANEKFNSVMLQIQFAEDKARQENVKIDAYRKQVEVDKQMIEDLKKRIAAEKELHSARALELEKHQKAHEAKRKLTEQAWNEFVKKVG